jgi:hypothetical protein
MKLLSSFCNLYFLLMLATTIGFKNSVGFNFSLSMGIIRYTTIRSIVAVKIKKVHWVSPEILG